MRHFVVALLLFTSILARAGDPSAGKIVHPLAPAPLLALLRSGGNVIYFRHAATLVSAQHHTNHLRFCSTQRNLSEGGRAQARAIGEAFRRLGIGVDKVLASPYCRTMDTGRLAFGRVESSMDLFALGQPDHPEDRSRAEWLRRRLGTPPTAPGKNTVLVGHGSSLDSVTGEFLSEGEAAIARPDGTGSFRLVARVQAEQWVDWSRPAAMTDAPAGASLR